MTNKTKIFVDGNCIICDMEISHYKQRAPDLFDIVDISNPEFNASQYGLNPKQVNINMHVLTPTGELKIGVDAFVHIWSQIEKYQFAAKLVQIRPIYYIAKLGYKVFTIVRPILPKKKH